MNYQVDEERDSDLWKKVLWLAALVICVLWAVDVLHCQNAIDLANPNQVKNILSPANGGCGFLNCPSTMNFPLENPTAGDSGRFQFEFPRKVKLVRLICDTDQGQLDLNFDVRTESSANAPGTPVMSSGTTCLPAGSVVVTTFVNDSIVEHVPVAILVSNVIGGPTIVRFHLKYILTK